MNNTPEADAVKFDDDRPRYDLLPGDALEAAAWVFKFGATKYAPYNWAGATGKPFRWGKLFRPVIGHLWAFWRRKDNDPESGLPHLWHALASLMMLVAYVARGIGTDDRDPTLVLPAAPGLPADPLIGSCPGCGTDVEVDNTPK